jgi:hypothetical protein
MGALTVLDLLTGIETAILGSPADVASPQSASGASGDGTDEEELRRFMIELRYGNRPAVPGWGHYVIAADPRFRNYLGRWSDLATAVEKCEPTGFVDLKKTIDELAAIVTAAESATMEEEALSIISAILPREPLSRVALIGLRFGLGGQLPTLDEVGNDMGLTRERVRQLQQGVSRELPRIPLPLAPAIDNSLQVIDHALPCGTRELAQALRAAGLSNVEGWTLAALRAIASVSGRELPPLEESDGAIGRPGELALKSMYRSAARAVSNFYGIGSVNQVISRVASKSRGTAGHLDSAAARAALNEHEIHWLDSEHFWTDHRSGRNRLVNTTLRMLAVHSPQTLLAIQEGLERHFSFRRASWSGKREFSELVVPERDLLHRFYCDHPDFEVEAKAVRSAHPISLDVLGAETRYMVEVLLGSPYHAMNRLDLLEACTTGGMNSSTVNIWLTYSECFQQLASNVWGLRGVVVPPDIVEGLQEQAIVRRQSTDNTSVCGSTASGHPWMARRLTPSQIFSKVIPFDWANATLEGVTLTAIDMEDGEPVGSLRFAGSFNWGYYRYFSKHRVKAGQVIRVTVDLEAEECYVELGGDELLDPPFDI